MEKLRETDDYVGNGVLEYNNNNNKENGVASMSTSPTTTKNGLLHKSGSKLGFSKKKAVNNSHNQNGGEPNGHLSIGNGHGKRLGK